MESGGVVGVREKYSEIIERRASISGVLKTEKHAFHPSSQILYYTHFYTEKQKEMPHHTNRD